MQYLYYIIKWRCTDCLFPWWISKSKSLYAYNINTKFLPFSRIDTSLPMGSCKRRRTAHAGLVDYSMIVGLVILHTCSYYQLQHRHLLVKNICDSNASVGSFVPCMVITFWPIRLQHYRRSINHLWTSLQVNKYYLFTYRYKFFTSFLQ